jgi:hypothetical protein
MAINIEADLSGCKVAFLTVPGQRLNGQPIKAIQQLLDMGIRHVKTLSLAEASAQYAMTQGRHEAIPEEQKYLKLTEKGNIVKLFS